MDFIRHRIFCSISLHKFRECLLNLSCFRSYPASGHLYIRAKCCVFTKPQNGGSFRHPRKTTQNRNSSATRPSSSYTHTPRLRKCQNTHVDARPANWVAALSDGLAGCAGILDDTNTRAMYICRRSVSLPLLSTSCTHTFEPSGNMAFVVPHPANISVK